MIISELGWSQADPFLNDEGSFLDTYLIQALVIVVKNLFKT